MSIFEDKNLKPMLIGESAEPFDSPDYIFELKLDGERCLGYFDFDGVEFRNKRNMRMDPKVPELADIYTQVSGPCILDGELIVMKEGKPNFFEIQRRSLMSNSFRIDLAAAKTPASFIAFDILYWKGKELLGLPLMERKLLLGQAVRNEGDRLAVSRYIEGEGKSYYKLVEEQDLEGIVAKRRDSLYYLGKRTKDWIKIKNLQDDDYVVCGYLEKVGAVASIILGQYRGEALIYKGHVTLGLSSDEMRWVKEQKTAACPFAKNPSGNEGAVWLVPELVCTVKFMMKHAGGMLRQPVFKGLRPDKEPRECVERDV